METKLNIPADFLPGFDAILQMPDENWQLLCKAVHSLPEGSGPDSMEQIFHKTPQLQGYPALAPTVFSLGSLVKEGSKPDALASSLVDAYQAVNHDVAEADRNRLNQRLQELFQNLHAISITFKAIQLMEEANQVYVDARIVSDIRLVFNEELDQQQRRALLIHTIHLSTREGRQKKETYFSCSQDDLKMLKEQIDRALRKEELIRQEYGTSIPFLDIKE